MSWHPCLILAKTVFSTYYPERNIYYSLSRQFKKERDDNTAIPFFYTLFYYLSYRNINDLFRYKNKFANTYTFQPFGRTRVT